MNVNNKDENVSILILSCDKNEDVWNPFFTLFYRYWNCPYQVYIATETKECKIENKNIVSIHCNYPISDWTKIIRETLQSIPSKYVLMMCDDFFFRKEVRQDVINKCITWMKANPNAAVFNFEKEQWNKLLDCSYDEFGMKPDNATYKHSCQPSLWNKEILIQLLDGNKDPWQWEMTNARNDFDYYIFKGEIKDLVFDYGYYHYNWVGLRKGKWIMEDVVPLFAKEGISINYLERGFYKEE